MSGPATLDDLLARHLRSLAHYLRALLPNAGDAAAALDEAILRIRRRGWQGGGGGFSAWAERIVGDVAADRRKAGGKPPFSDDLFRQLAATPGPPPAPTEARARALAEALHQLPPPERELLRRKYGVGLTTDQIASADGRAPSVVARDLAGLHGSLVAALHATAPDGGPEPPGGAADLGRMAGQLFDGTITDDSRLVFETLLLADAPAQAHYRRHVALVTDLTWTYRGVPALPQPPTAVDRPPLSRRERIVTAAFVAACAIAGLLVVLLLTGFLKL